MSSASTTLGEIKKRASSVAASDDGTPESASDSPFPLNVIASRVAWCSGRDTSCCASLRASCAAVMRRGGRGLCAARPRQPTSPSSARVFRAITVSTESRARVCAARVSSLSRSARCTSSALSRSMASRRSCQTPHHKQSRELNEKGYNYEDWRTTICAYEIPWASPFKNIGRRCLITSESKYLKPTIHTCACCSRRAAK